MTRIAITIHGIPKRAPTNKRTHAELSKIRALLRLSNTRIDRCIVFMLYVNKS
jgi:hypothetical protein